MLSQNAKPKPQAGTANKGLPQVFPPSYGQASREPTTRGKPTITSCERVPHESTCPGAAPVSCIQTPSNKERTAGKSTAIFPWRTCWLKRPKEIFEVLDLAFSPLRSPSLLQISSLSLPLSEQLFGTQCQTLIFCLPQSSFLS